MQASGAKLPLFTRFPITGHETGNRVIPDIRRFHENAELLRNVRFHKIIETESLSFKGGFHQPVTGVGIGNL